MSCLSQLQRGLTVAVFLSVDLLCTNHLLKHCRATHVWETGNIRNTCVTFSVAGTPQCYIGSKEESDAPVLSGKGLPNPGEQTEIQLRLVLALVKNQLQLLQYRKEILT